jgi:predicted enzyme related to lactoylglutathione lyase
MVMSLFDPSDHHPEQIPEQPSCSRFLSILMSIPTPNLPQLRQFYQDLLQVTPLVVLGEKYVEFELLGARLALYHQRSEQNLQVHPEGSISLCLQVTSLEAMLKSFEPQSISEVRVAFHGREVDIWDPDGNRIVLHEPSAAFLSLTDPEKTRFQYFSKSLRLAEGESDAESHP